MPSRTRTPEQSRTVAIHTAAHCANTLAVLLGTLELMAPSAAQNALNVCAELSSEVDDCLAIVAGDVPMDSASEKRPDVMPNKGQEQVERIRQLAFDVETQGAETKIYLGAIVEKLDGLGVLSDKVLDAVNAIHCFVNGAGRSVSDALATANQMLDVINQMNVGNRVAGDISLSCGGAA